MNPINDRKLEKEFAHFKRDYGWTLLVYHVRPRQYRQSSMTDHYLVVYETADGRYFQADMKISWHDTRLYHEKEITEQTAKKLGRYRHLSTEELDIAHHEINSGFLYESDGTLRENQVEQEILQLLYSRIKQPTLVQLYNGQNIPIQNIIWANGEGKEWCSIITNVNPPHPQLPSIEFSTEDVYQIIDLSSKEVIWTRPRK